MGGKIFIVYLVVIVKTVDCQQTLVGGFCASAATCVGGTACKFIDGASKCVCDVDFLENTEKRCNVGYSANCDTYVYAQIDHRSCFKNFVCIDGKCQCPYPNSQLANPGDKKCLTVVSGNCSNTLDCVLNAQCLNGICSCISGYTENANGSCVLDYGSPCNYTRPSAWDIQSGTVSICDPLVPLNCYGGICSCMDPSSTFNRVDRSCRLSLGSRCNSTRGNKCIEGAFCAPNHISPELPGHCKASTTEKSST